MSASSRSITLAVVVALIVVASVTAWFATRKSEQPGREQAAVTQKPAEASAGLPATGDPTKTDAPPVLPGKSHERPSPAELEQKKYERMKAEMTAKLEELEAGGMGKVHPNVRAVQQQLDALEADHAGRTPPAR